MYSREKKVLLKNSGPVRKALFIGPPKKDRKQSIKIKNNRSLSFHFDFLGLSVLSGFSDFPLYLNNFFIKRIYMPIIRTSSMRGLRLCALFVVSTNISRVIDENVRKMEDMKI